jgi:hypothetical protein
MSNVKSLNILAWPNSNAEQGPPEDTNDKELFDMVMPASDKDRGKILSDEPLPFTYPGVVVQLAANPEAVGDRDAENIYRDLSSDCAAGDRVHVKVRFPKDTSAATRRRLHFALSQCDPDWPFVVLPPPVHEAGTMPARCPICGGLEYINPSISPWLIQAIADQMHIPITEITYTSSAECWDDWKAKQPRRTGRAALVKSISTIKDEEAALVEAVLDSEPEEPKEETPVVFDRSAPEVLAFCRAWGVDPSAPELPEFYAVYGVVPIGGSIQ